MQGLSSAEVNLRIAKGEVNRSPKFTTRTIPAILGHNIVNFFNGILLLAVIALLLIHARGDAVFVASVTFFNTLASIVEEIRAKIALDRIALLQKRTVTVIREGRKQEIALDAVVLDDLIMLSRGEQIIADGVLLTDTPLSIDESLLTGEANARDKNPGDELLSGTFCVSGNGIYQATKVGIQAQVNTLTAQAKFYKVAVTPLQRDINRLVEGLTVVMLVFVILLLLVHFAIHIPVAQSVLAAVTIIKAFVPQGLVLFATLAFAFGAIRIARQNVLVQKLNAIEAMSNVTTLCFDKTGTLGTNNLLFSHLVVLDYLTVDIELRLAQFANAFEDKNSSLLAIHKAFSADPIAALNTLPFSSATKVSAVELKIGDDQVSYWLGAPEILTQNKLSSEEIEILHNLRNSGFRVLLFAETVELLPNRDRLNKLAFVVLKDELRTNVTNAIKYFEARNISLKILSGDHPETITAIAKQTGMRIDGASVNGQELFSLPAKQFNEVVKHGQFFGNLLPQQKQQIIKTLQQTGENVGMIGDGVNDVLALKQADIGVAMYSGAAAARDVSDIVLLQDNFTHLPALAAEGDRIIFNLKRVARLFITKNVYCFFYILLTLVLGMSFPLTPRYVTWIDGLTLGMPCALLLLMVPELHRQTAQHFLRDTLKFAFGVGIPIALVATCAYLYFYFIVSKDVLVARTAAAWVIILLNLFLFYAVTAVERHTYFHSLQKLAVVAIILAAIVANIVIFSVSWLRQLFIVAKLNYLSWLFIGLIALIGILVVAEALRIFCGDCFNKQKYLTMKG